MALAIFDIDGTLVTGISTERRFYRYLLRSGHQGARQLLAGLAFLMYWGPYYGRHTLKKNKAYLTGLDCDKLALLARQWSATALEDAWFAPALQRLRRHQDSGDRVLLLSGTPDFLAAAIAARLGVNDYLGSRCDQRGNVFGWRPPLRHPFGPEKRWLASQYCARADIAATAVTAYADSSHDLELLRWCGKAVAVRPDQRLLAVARANHWEILDEPQPRHTKQLRPF